MLTAEAHVQTDRASRYLSQLCRHAKQMGHHLGPRGHQDARPEVLQVDWSDTEGTVRLNWGQWTLRADPTMLTLRVEAENEKDLRRMRDLLTARIEKIGRRDHLTVTWQGSDVVEPDPPRKRRSRTGRWLLVGGGVVLLVAVHVGLGGAALASRWTDWTVLGLAAVFLLKIIGLRLLTARRRRL